MIELLLVADRLLAAGDLDRAERIYQQVVEADPRNAIAVVGLARVARARGLSSIAEDHLWRALDIDPQDQAAQRLAMAWAAVAAAPGDQAADPVFASAPADAAAAPSTDAVELAPVAHAAVPASPPPSEQVTARPSWLARIRAFLGLGAVLFGP
jgi:tetratricopeptide (TPR) repeat protein